MHIKRLWAALCAALFLLGAVPMTVGAASSYLEAGDKTYFKTRQAQRGGTGEGYVSSLGTRVNLMWFDQSPTNSYIDKYDLTPQYDGKVWAYCIHHGLSYGHPFRKTVNLTDSAYWNSLGRSAQQSMKLTTIYGFPARTPAELGVSTIDDAVAATQAVLWEYQQGYRTNAVTLGNDAEYKAFIKGTPAEPAYHKILEGIRNHTTAAGFADSTLVLKPQSDGRYAVTVTDTKGVLSDFSVTPSDSRVTAKINGNTLTLSSTEAIEGNITLTFQRILPPLSRHGVFVAVGRNAGEQEIMTGVADDPYSFRATARVEAKGAMQIRKVSEDGKVDGVRFLVSGNGLNDTFVTANGGMLDIPDLTAGEYTVTEQAGGAYEPQKSQTVTVVPGQTTTVTFNNTLKRGGLRVVKTSEDNWLEGHTFRLSGTSLSGDRVEVYAKTDSAGVAEFRDVLVSGNAPYLLEEVDTDERYVVPSAQNVLVEWNKVTDKTVVNRLKKWSLTVSKADAEISTPQGDGSLCGAQYGLYRHGALQKVYTTDADGRFTTDWYPCGDGWSLQEITPSPGYQLDTNEYALGVEPGRYTMEYNAEALTVRESVIKGRVAILKHNDNGSTQIETPEVGAVFEVYLQSAGSYEQARKTERDRLVTDEFGYAASKWLPYGIYTVKQTKGREGTELLPAFAVYIDEQGKVYRYLINNASFESHLEVVKKDAETGEIIPLSGFGFKIRDIETGKYITQHITYVSNNHQAIVDDAVFDRVQVELARRASKRKMSEKTAKTAQGKYSSKYALTELLICGCCGSRYRRVTWARNGQKKIVWRCISRLDFGTTYCKESPTLEESQLHEGIVRAIAEKIAREDALETLKTNIGRAVYGNGNDNVYALQYRIQALKERRMELVRQSVACADESQYDEAFKTIGDEIQGLYRQLEALQEQEVPCDDIFEALEQYRDKPFAYDDVMVRQLLGCVKVLAEDRILVAFKDNSEMEVILE